MVTCEQDQVVSPRVEGRRMPRRPDRGRYSRTYEAFPLPLRFVDVERLYHNDRKVKKLWMSDHSMAPVFLTTTTARQMGPLVVTVRDCVAIEAR
ncbi:hypothetical protein EVAR_444_1 [Eumeta japonica]|uniref:Uncharacterized protein n=1 Tax=Eumeta variegata TaxID=151549 RepID=A0A4C1SB95_EUMVA|nr:hypothetical protein EVAR_444_1 [Eumeta japonica]